MEQKRKKMGTAALIAIGVLFSTLLITGYGYVRPSYADVEIGAKNPPVNVDPKSYSRPFIEAAKSVTPSIVQINVVADNKEKYNDEFFRFFFPFKDFDVPREQLGSGSGVIISPDGYILTNNHVVENATKVTVGLHDKRTLEATVIGTDPSTDLAVIKVDENALPVAYLGNSDDLEVGQWVMAIGNPLSLSSTVTTGIISALGRDINIIKGSSTPIENFIQTDAAINPGNSGGALIDLSGAVIGINTAIATGQTGTYIGYGFAIPINLAKSIAKELIASGKVNRGFIGVNINEVDAATAKAIGLGKPRGVMIQGLVKDGAAERASLKEGDVILKVDNKEVNQPNELQSYVASKIAGAKVNLLIFRDGKEFETQVTLKSRSGDDPQESENDAKSGQTKKKGEIEKKDFENLGLSVKDMTKAELEAYKVSNGILITDVKTLGKAYAQRLFPGAVITQVDKKKIESVSEFDELIKSKKGSAVLLKLVDKKGTTFFVGMEIP